MEENKNINNLGDEEFEDLDSTIILSDENGNDTEFELLDSFEMNGKEYIVLLPKDEQEDADEVIILRVEKVNDEEEEYVNIEDDEELNKVFEEFKSRCKDEFEFVEE